jgi:hypothetical protein
LGFRPFEVFSSHLADIVEDAGISEGKPLGTRPGERTVEAARRQLPIVVMARLDRLIIAESCRVPLIVRLSRLRSHSFPLSHHRRTCY